MIAGFVGGFEPIGHWILPYFLGGGLKDLRVSTFKTVD